jgi:2-polyprenyl-3-methyl-5-hydroxy-6-metoxy-1,4-benzoquinol methylase
MLTGELRYVRDNIYNPTWVLMYKLKWTQLADMIELKNLKILDFGSGFGLTANYLAKDNEVIAIEAREDCIEERIRENNYTQIQGKSEKLKDFADGSFDVIICHNVLEFNPEERPEIVREFSRLLKTGGILSIIKNNGPGRIMALVVDNNDIDKATNLLEGGYNANVFGRVVLYDPEDLVKWSDSLKIEKILSARTFSGLQRDEIKHEPGWVDKMFEIEMKVSDLEPYKSIALFHHVLMRKF